MQFPEYRARRLRKNENFRRLIRETSLSVDDLVYPLFAVPGKEFQKTDFVHAGSISDCPSTILPKKRKRRANWESRPSCSSAFRRKKMRWPQALLPKTVLFSRPSRELKMKCPTFW